MVRRSGLPMPVAGRSLRQEAQSRKRWGPRVVRRSGLPVPHRRSFAQDILSFAHSDAACASPSWLRLAAYAGSRGTGSPSLHHRLHHHSCGTSDRGAAGSGARAEAGATCAPRGPRRSLGAQNSQVPPASSMPPAGCGAAPANPSGPSAAYATAGTRPAIARHGEPPLHHRRAKPAGARECVRCRAAAERRPRPPGGRPPPGWSHLGCDHAGPSPRGPWMAPRA